MFGAIIEGILAFLVVLFGIFFVEKGIKHNAQQPEQHKQDQKRHGDIENVAFYMLISPPDENSSQDKPGDFHTGSN